MTYRTSSLGYPDSTHDVTHTVVMDDPDLLLGPDDDRRGPPRGSGGPIVPTHGHNTRSRTAVADSARPI